MILGSQALETYIRNVENTALLLKTAIESLR
jgi:hypothetical protein